MFQFRKINYAQYAQPPSPSEHPAQIAAEICSKVNENYDQLKSKEWILGVANAGQGAVIGPTIYTVCYWPKKYQALIVEKTNLEQSKFLPTDQVLNLFRIFNELRGKVLEYETYQLSAAYLSKTQLAAKPINLKEITHQIVLYLIQNALDNGFNITECCMYKFGNDSEQKNYFDGELKSSMIVRVEGSADILFRVVSAASICAKGVWEEEMEKIKKKINRNFGNGHPNDTRTQNFMYNNIIPVFGYSDEIRFSWSTTENAMRQRGLLVDYYDEDNEEPIIKYKQEQQDKKIQKYRHLDIQQIFI